uniref:Peptidase M14 domain-containing protein n=1 Tax=Eiseniibacteriota bacterium TaxID=2212470 RepID=A0A832I0K5_UNCEI
MRRRSTLAALAVPLLLAAPPAAAATARFDFYDRGPYRDAVPRPSAVLGYAPGAFHTTWGGLERYLDAVLRAAPDRVRREPYGRTVEARERALVILSSPENLARLDAIRAGNARLADPRGVPPAEAARLVRDLPATVWLNYSIHGDESASFESLMQTVYQLAAGEDSTTRAILERCVVLVNAAHNPDGHERFVTWINAHGKGDPEPWAIEQQRRQPWGITGRYTHYQFDPNRDALAMSQPESRQMARAVRRWRPQVFVDHHGQTASFFFPPTAPPTNRQLWDGSFARWSEAFGRANAEAFDRYGWNYYVRDVFDAHATGYWDMWPTLMGAIGMTFETDGGGTMALRRDDETVVTLLDGIARHAVATMTTLETTARLRAERLADFAAFARASVTPAPDGARSIVLDAGPDPGRAAALAENLLHAGVEVRWVPEAFALRAARAMWEDGPTAPLPADPKALAARPARVGSPPPAPARAGARAFPHGAFVVDLAQPGGRIARAILEHDRSIDSAFARRQLEKYERNVRRGKRTPGEHYEFYDLTAWMLPAAYGVPAFATAEATPAGRLLAAPDPDGLDEGRDEIPDSLATGIPFTARASRWDGLVLRDADGAIAFDGRGGVDGGEARTAYVWSSADHGAGRLALRLLQEDFKVAASPEPLVAGGREWPRGSFIARVERNPAALHARVARLARLSGVRVRAVHSAWIERGTTGVGSEAVRSLRRPRIAVAVDAPVSPEAYGSLWFLFERRLGVRFTAVRVQDLAGIELDRYNVVVFPDGGPGLAGRLGAGGIGALKDWVARGGTLLCLDDAAEFPALKEVGLSSARVVGVPHRDKEKDAKADDAPPDSAALEAERRPELVPGSIFWASVDPRHFLGWGFGAPRVPVPVWGRTFLTPSREGANPLRFDRAPLTLDGWTWPETERRLAGTAYAVDEPNGRGHVVMIAGPPALRGFWRNTERLVTNALLYAPAMR